MRSSISLEILKGKEIIVATAGVAGGVGSRPDAAGGANAAGTDEEMQLTPEQLRKMKKMEEMAKKVAALQAKKKSSQPSSSSFTTTITTTSSSAGEIAEQGSCS